MSARQLADPHDLSDILRGRIDVLRSNIDGIIEEFAARARGNGEQNESLAMLLKTRLELAMQNISLLDKFGPKFEEQTNSQPTVTSSNRNLLLEFQWKHETQERGIKALHTFREQLAFHFPRLEALGDIPCPPPPPSYFTPKSAKRAKLADDSSTLPVDLEGILNAISQRNPFLKFYVNVVTGKHGRKKISGIKCELGEILNAYISFLPAVPKGGPEGDGRDPSTPCTPRTPNSPSPLLTRSMRSSTRSRRATPQRRSNLKKKKEDMVTKAAEAAAEASAQEAAEAAARAAVAAAEAAFEDAVKAAAMQITFHIERVAIFAFEETCPMGAWDESKHMAFRKISEHAREALRHFSVHFPDNSLRHFFTWLGYYHDLYDARCSGCKRHLVKESDKMMFLLPTFRDYSTGRAYHPQCLPA